MKKSMKSNNSYFIINIDEPYAKAIYEVLKAGQIAKGEWPEGDISFEEWKIRTFNKICSTCNKSKYINDSYYGKELYCVNCTGNNKKVVDEDDTCDNWEPKKINRKRLI